MRLENIFKDYNGRILLEVCNSSGVILEAFVYHDSWHNPQLHLMYVMKDPSIGNSCCLSGYKHGGDIINLMQEAYTVFDQGIVPLEELNYLGYTAL